MALLAAAWLTRLAPAPGLAGQELPRFEPGPCPFEGEAWAAEHRIDCGSLVVPESRGEPSGRVLRLAVAVLRSTAPEPEPDPVVFLQGGPGGASLLFAQAFARSPFWRALRERRDLVLWDQRGTGYSEPAFCPDLSAQLLALDLAATAEGDRVRAARSLLAECRSRMLDDGLDFAAYNSDTSARDLDDLRRLLGYERWNLFGGSYGTRLALVAARDRPEGVRSLILDSTSPVDVGGDALREDLLARSMGLVFDQCAADAACRTLFPDLEEEFYATIDELDARALTVQMEDTARFAGGRIVVDGRLFALGLFQGLYDADFIPLVPHAIRQLRARNTSLVRALARELVADPDRENPWLFYAVECYEHEPLLSPDVAAGVHARNPRLPSMNEPSLAAVCDAWHSARADTAVLRRPVTADVPALVAAGEFDPITPPGLGRHVAAALPRSQYVEFRGMGHGTLPFSRCGETLVVQFLEVPDRPLETSCLDERPGVAFLTDIRIAPGIGATALRLSDGPGWPWLLWLGATLLLLASAVLTWPIAALVRRLRGRGGRARGGGRAARWVAGLTALGALGFVGGLAMAVAKATATNPMVLGFGLPGRAGALLALPWVLAVLAGATVVCAALAWRRRWWGRAGRVHYALVALASVSFAVWAVGLVIA
jgi:pimeloyl-ACP methyl ester carboxylesterase